MKEGYTLNFSVLMSIYKKEKSMYFRESLNSIINQTLQPTEIVIVKDGVLTQELDEVCIEYQKKYEGLFKFVELKKNQGLGKALQIGLQNCEYDIIARMDSDDIAKPNRFELQIKEFEEDKELVLIGSFIEEFSVSPNKIDTVRKVPEKYEEILTYARKRNPFNHMTVMFQKEKVLSVGNYPDVSLMQDYYLWVKLLKKGYKAKNLREPLVFVRADKNLFARRGGISYFVREIRMQNIFRHEGFIDWSDFIKNICIRGSVRIKPNSMRKLFYRKILR